MMTPQEYPQVIRIEALNDVLLVERAASGAAFARLEGSPATAAVTLAVLATTSEGVSGRSRLDVDFARSANLLWVEYARVGDEHRFVQLDPQLDLRVCTTLRIDGMDGTVTGSTVVENLGSSSIELAFVSSFAIGGLLNVGHRGASILMARNSWLAENRWYATPVSALLPRINPVVHLQQSRTIMESVGSGIWSTSEAFPGGYIAEQEGGRSIGWELLAAGGWTWQLGERDGYAWLSFSGADDTHHNAARVLAPGDGHTSATATIASGPSGWQSAVESMTRARRGRRKDHQDVAAPALIYNDYLNTLMADPDEESVLRLGKAAVRAGAEIYCIDAGWYDEARDGWWDSIGAWEEALSRFPRGLRVVRDEFAAVGLKLGIWLELESVGVRSPVSRALPDEAYVSRGGKRLTVNGRNLLDLRSPAAVQHLTGSLERVLTATGASFVKLDCNVTPGAGFDDALAGGAALEDSSRAYAAWLSETVQAHPELLVENCASGAMRADAALLSSAHLQSTSDQQDFRLYPTIAVNAPLTIPVEQCGNWASVQPEMSLEDASFTLVTGLAGRLYLSGFLDELSDHVFAVVAEASEFFRSNRELLSTTQCRWPLGPAQWNDEWLALMHVHPGGTALLFVWSRNDHPSSVTMDVAGFDPASAIQVFPTALPPWQSEAVGQHLTLSADEGHQARVFRLSARESHA